MIRVEYILLFRGDRIEGIILGTTERFEHWDFANKAGLDSPVFVVPGPTSLGDDYFHAFHLFKSESCPISIHLVVEGLMPS